MRIVFMGTPSYATRILQALVAQRECEVVLLVTQEDKPVGRKQILTPPDTKAWAQEHAPSLEIYQPKRLRNNDEAVCKIAACRPDFIVVAAYGQILPASILALAPCINLHASLLPKYRGASPIQSTLLADEAYAGVTSMLMEEGLDTGAMLGFSYVHVKPSDTSEHLFEVLSDAAASLTLKTLAHFEQLQPWKQVDAAMTHCRKIKKEDGLVSWHEKAQTLMCKYRAFTPWPGIYLASGLKLTELSLMDAAGKNSRIGCIERITNEGVVVACAQGSLLISKVQPSSKNAMHVLDYIRGKRLACGDSMV